MNLLLRIAGPNLTQDVPLSRGAETTLGRDASADVVLSDPDKWISRKHLAVRQADDGLELRVVSTVNGVDTSRGTVERGQRINLSVGDHITLGLYHIDVVIGAAAAASTNLTSASPTLGNSSSPTLPSGTDDPFALLLGAGSMADHRDDPFARPEFRPAVRPAPNDGRDPFSELVGTGTSNKPSPVPASPSDSFGGLLGAAPDRGNAAGTAGSLMGAPRSGSSGGPLDSNAQLNDWLGGGTPRPTGSLGGSGPLDVFLGRSEPVAARALSPDHVHGIHLPLSFKPAAAPPNVHALPISPAFPPKESSSMSSLSDVWADLERSTGEPMPVPPAVMSPAASNPASAARTDPSKPVDAPFRNIDNSFHDDAFSEWESTGPAPPGFERGFPDSGPVMSSRLGGGETATPHPAAKAEMATAPPTEVVESVMEQTGSWAAFASGLGLSATHPFDDASVRHAGTMVKLLLEGLADLLSARADLKRELRAADRTMLSGRDNNPLKLKLSSAELVQYLFAAQTAGAYMPAERAVRESVTELCVHEHATIAAARAAVEGALRDFEPGRLKKQLIKGKPSMFQKLDHARLWAAYQQHYEKQSEHMADWLESVFSRHFMPTYSRETERLKLLAADDAEGPSPT